jgi:hypothetical protein
MSTSHGTHDIAPGPFVGGVELVVNMPLRAIFLSLVGADVWSIDAVIARRLPHQHDAAAGRS